MAESSFDIEAGVDRQEVDNAINQAAREVATRFDFKDTSTVVAWAGDEAIQVESASEDRVKAALEVLKDKFVKRKVSLKALEYALELGRQAEGCVTVLSALEYLDPEEPREHVEFNRRRRQRFLNHAIHACLIPIRQRVDAPLDVQLDVDAKPARRIADVPLERGAEATVVEHAGPESERQIAHRAEHLVHELFGLSDCRTHPAIGG